MFLYADRFGVEKIYGPRVLNSGMTSTHSELSMEIEPLVNFNIGLQLLEEQRKVRPLGSIRQSDRLSTPRKKFVKVKDGREIFIPYGEGIDYDSLNVSRLLMSREGSNFLKDGGRHSPLLSARLPHRRNGPEQDCLSKKPHEGTLDRPPIGHNIKFRRKKKVIHLPLFQINLEELEENSKDAKSVEHTRSKLRSLIRAQSSQGERLQSVESDGRQLGDFKFVTPAEQQKKHDAYSIQVSSKTSNSDTEQWKCSTTMPSSRTQMHTPLSPRSLLSGALPQKAPGQNIDQGIFENQTFESALKRFRNTGTSNVSAEGPPGNRRSLGRHIACSTGSCEEKIEDHVLNSKSTNRKSTPNKAFASVPSKTSDLRINSAGALRSTVFPMDLLPESPDRGAKIPTNLPQSHISPLRQNTWSASEMQRKADIDENESMTQLKTDPTNRKNNRLNDSANPLPVLRYTIKKTNASEIAGNPMASSLHSQSHSKCPMCLIGLDEEYDTSAMPCPPNSPRNSELGDDLLINLDNDSVWSDKRNTGTPGDYEECNSELESESSKPTKGTNTDKIQC